MSEPTKFMTPRYRQYCEACECLGSVTVNGRHADLFVCEDLVIARFGDEPGNQEVEHMRRLTIHSSVFLLAAFRLHLDRQGERPVPANEILHVQRPMRS